MNARVFAAATLTTVEVNAHLAILGTLELRLTKRIGWRKAHALCCQPLEAFAPRCNCGHRLVFSPWVDELRSARCNWCGAGWREAPL